MSSENRETQHASGTTLPSHPVELGESDMENSRSVNPEVQQLRSEARAHHGQHTGAGTHQTGTDSQYGEGYTSDGIPPPLNIPSEYGGSTGSAPHSSGTEHHSSSLQEAVPASTDHGIADSHTTAQHDSAVSSSPVSPTKSENRGFFSRVMGSFMPGTSEAGSDTGTATSNTNTNQARFLHHAPSASWGKPTDTADIDVVKQQGVEKADETGLDPATATKLAGLDSAAAYNKHEPAIAAAEVLQENKSDARQETAAAGGIAHREPHSPERNTEVFSTPQTSPGHHSTGSTGYDQSYGQRAQTDSYQDTGSNQGVVSKLASAVGLGGASANSGDDRSHQEQYSDAVPHNTVSATRTRSFENRPFSGEGWSKYRSPEKSTDAAYGQSQQYGDSQRGVPGDNRTEQGYNSDNQGYSDMSERQQTQHSYGTGSDRQLGSGSNQQYGSESQQGYSNKPDNRYGSESYGNQSDQSYADRGSRNSATEQLQDSTSNVSALGQHRDQYSTGYDQGYGQGHAQGVQTGSYADTSDNQGVISKLASAVGLGGASGTAQHGEQYGNQSSTGTGYGQGAQTDSYADNSSNQGIGSKLAAAVGLGGAQQQPEQYGNEGYTGSDYRQGAQTDTYGDNSNNQGIGSKLASAVGLGGTSAQQGQYGSQSTGTGYGQGYESGAQTDSYANTSGSNQGIGSKLASAVGLGGTAQQGQYGNESSTGTGYGQSYGQGAQTDSYGNTSGSSQGAGSKMASAVGLGSAAQGTSGETGTISRVTRSLSNAPPSASWGASSYQPEVGQTTTGSGYTPTTGSSYTPVTASGTGHTSGTASGSNTAGYTDTGSNQGVASKVANAVGLGGASQESAGDTRTGSSISDRATGSDAAGHAPGTKGEDRLTEPVHTGTDSTTAGYTDAGRHETPVQQSGQAFTDETASGLGTQTKHNPSIGTTALEHASSPRLASNKPTAFSTGTGAGAGTGIGSSSGTGTGAGLQQSQTTGTAQPPASFGTTAAEHALSRTSGTPLNRSSAESLPPTSVKKLSATPEGSSAAQPSNTMGTTAAEHALRRTSGSPLARDSGAATNPASTSKLGSTETGTGNTRTTSDLPVSTNAPPASARPTQDAPAATTAAKTEGTNGTAVPSTAATTTATKPTAAGTATSGIGSQGKPAVPAQPSKPAQAGKKNGILACFTCGQKSTTE